MDPSFNQEYANIVEFWSDHRIWICLDVRQEYGEFLTWHQFQYDISRTYGDVVDYVLREFEVRPVHGCQGTKVTRVEYYILGPHQFD